MKYKFVDAEYKIKKLQERQSGLEAKHREAEEEVELLLLIPEDERDDNTALLISQRETLMAALTTAHEQLQTLIDNINKEEALSKKNGKAKKKSDRDEADASADLIQINGNRNGKRAAKKSAAAKPSVS